ncbi:MAG: ferredoxin--NADP+ reductase [Planctomycetota bacterium]|jgi:ferredoxin--NADP+ reductase
MASWLKAKVIENRRWTDELTSLIIDAPLGAFESGQFIRIGVEDGDEVLARPYSLVNTAQEKYLEVYFNIVDEGPLSPKLFALQAGDDVMVADNPNGFLTVSEVPECKHLWLMATGTGIGPFLSILKSDAVWKKFEKVILVFSVRTLAEMAYREEIDKIVAAHPEQFCFIPTITREDNPDALKARMPASMQNGDLEKRAGVELNAENSHVMMCGSSEMIKDVSEGLVARGMKKHRRRDPGHFTTEKYH